MKRRVLHWIVGFLVLLPAAGAAAHPKSMSSTRVRVEADGIVVRVRCQAPALAEVIPGLDADADGTVTAFEVAENADAVRAYIDRHSVLSVDGRSLAPDSSTIDYGAAGVAQDIPGAGGTVDVVRRYRLAGTPRDVSMKMTLFRVTGPDHVDLLTVEWSAERSDHFALSAHRPRATSGAAPPGTFGPFFVVGLRHILTGWDHLVFVLALLLASRTVRSLLGVVTAFTVAHSVSLALVALGLVDLSGHTNLIEALIALSIAYVAVDSLVHPRTRRGRWIEAFGFGLLHGLGFAAFIRRSLFFESKRWTALFAFNLGVEVGQIVFVLVVVAAMAVFIPRRARAARDGLAPPWLRTVGLTAAAGLGLVWFFGRV